MRAKRNQLWIETMQAVTAGASSEMEIDDGTDPSKGKQREGDLATSLSRDNRLSSVVNSEKRYWRKPAAQKRAANDGRRGFPT